MALGLEPVIAALGGDRVEGDDQVWAASGGAQLPGAVTAGRPGLAGGGEGEPAPWGAAGAAGAAGWVASVRRAGFTTFRSFPVTLGFGSGTAVPDGVPLRVGHRDAPC